VERRRERERRRKRGKERFKNKKSCIKVRIKGDRSCSSLL
jgi:hypothetical protein